MIAAAPSAPIAASRAACHTGLDGLRPGYDEVFREAAAQSMFYSLPWFRNFLDTVTVPGERARLYSACGPHGGPGALLLLQAARPRGAFAPRKLRSLANYYSSLFGPVSALRGAALAGALQVIAAAIAAERPRWHAVELQPLSLAAESFELLERAFAGEGFITDRFFCFGNWYLPVDGRPFAEYLATRPSRLSKTGAHHRRKLEASGRFRFRLYTSVEDHAQGVADYETVYASSWKVPEPYAAFVGGLARRFAEQGWLRLGVAYLDGQPAAAQLWMVVEGTASIFKMAYDERYNKESVGTVLSSLLMQHVMEVDRVHTVDYLTGDDGYKRDWMTHRRERWGLVAFNPRTARGLASAARHFAGKAARRMLGRGATK
ncbi:MAG: GNAT family N-acetyltransferase [Betaproteobacteria bacterium]